jgi:5'-phosphate synthase pdxT subunit
MKNLVKNGLPVFGTCAGMILLANEVSDGNIVESLGVMQIKVRRNAFGRQRESFETELDIPVLGEKPFPGVFIRAPIIEQANTGVEILARLENGTIVAARQDKLLVSAFHPELTDDLRFHQYFLDIISGER